MPNSKSVVRNPKRFVASGYAASAMQEVSDRLIADGIKIRLAKALDLNDSPAPTLAPRTAKEKSRKGLPALRNWWKTGRTIRSMKTLEAGPNRAVVGFTDAITNRRAYFNNRLHAQFGVAPSDERVIQSEMSKHRPVEVVDGR